MTQVLDIIQGALRAVGALESGETPDSPTANDALLLLNDMIASWANSKMLLPYTASASFTLTPSVYQYTIGPGGTAGGSIVGSISGFILTVTSVVSGAIALGQQLSGAGITPGTTISAYGTGAGGGGALAAGTYTLNISQTVASETIAVSYQRPLRINSAFVRVSSLDYPVQVLNIEDYERIGFKTLNSSWPKALYYRPSYPLGQISFWPNPTVGEIHLFCDLVISNFNSIADIVLLPQGYNLALRYGLAELMLPEYGSTTGTDSQTLVRQYAANGRAMIKRTNMQPQQTVHVDPMLISSQGGDKSFIFTGGFS